MCSIVSGLRRRTGPEVAWMAWWILTASSPLIDSQKNSQLPPSSTQ